MKSDNEYMFVYVSISSIYFYREKAFRLFTVYAIENDVKEICVNLN